ncbi:UNVERIFIED_CONTAM: hypothetical protein PYX00_007011 [Menopon gallinae]|uniref:HTH CENPB-type domain-containing protein n=1 Tax=Menopon gallinae TaxID=328185 RepID=A0AAW2HHH8_9NEOP
MMAPIKKPVGKKEMITMELKKEIVEKHERGLRVSDIARYYNKSTSTISTILKRKDEIRALEVAKGVTKVSKQRPRALEDVENLLLVWVNEKQLSGDSVTEASICEKAKALYADVVDKQPGASTDDFKASRGWYENFKKRSGIVVRQGEAVNSASEFASRFQEIVLTRCYLPQQVFNCDETSLFWKRMPRRTYLTAEESAVPGHKPMKDRLTLLLCANASGEFKVKPLLVYHSENPRAFKKCKVQKSEMSVMWKSNSNARLIRVFFVEWVNKVFGPAVKQYLLENNLPLKALLIMDSDPAHVPDLEDYLPEEFNFINFMILPASTTSLLQPMNQGIISDFKIRYTKELFQHCFDATEGITLREYWKNQFHIVKCLKVIDKAWEGITKKVINSAWGKLWPECVLDTKEQDLPVIQDILSLGKNMGLEVNEEDVQELVKEHRHEPTLEELMDLHLEQQQEATLESSVEEEEGPTSDEIREVCEKWEMVRHFVEKHHPNKATVLPATREFNDVAMSHFREVLRRRQTISSVSVMMEMKTDDITIEAAECNDYFSIEQCNDLPQS